MSHPSADQLEAAAFGWMPESQAIDIRGHAASCARCGPLLRREDSVHRRLGLLRGEEPRIDVSERVLHQLVRGAARGGLPRPGRALVVALALVLAGLLLGSNGNVRRTVQRLGGILTSQSA